MRSFLKETDLSAPEAAAVFSVARRLKADRLRYSTPEVLKGQSWGMMFFKNSTRTRVSFEVGLAELGAKVLMLEAKSMQLSRGETEADTARILARYLHGLVIRCFGHETLETFAREGGRPVVNALSDFLHPCQIYADAFTLAERFDPEANSMASLRGKKLAFLGDSACNMANSWILGGALFGMEIALSGPAKYEPCAEIRDLTERESARLGLKAPRAVFTTDPTEAVRNADVVYTDVWVSMGMEAEEEARLKEMAPYQVNAALMAKAKPGALFMHCLPAHPGQEVAQEVMDSPASIILDEAENRLHIQKAILHFLAEHNRA